MASCTDLNKLSSTTDYRPIMKVVFEKKSSILSKIDKHTCFVNHSGRYHIIYYYQYMIYLSRSNAHVISKTFVIMLNPDENDRKDNLLIYICVCMSDI